MLTLVKREDQDEMQDYAAFYLGLHCSLYSFRCFQNTKGYKDNLPFEIPMSIKIFM